MLRACHDARANCPGRADALHRGPAGLAQLELEAVLGELLLEEVLDEDVLDEDVLDDEEDDEEVDEDDGEDDDERLSVL